ncbi:hypothetical protein L1987_38735 [Smallanthus sonchifolius]|uniref:Uncharacterized protein n=1 Tax=Smallanthus sonchifolius TaxID=185202 RepID=A0ACB9HJW8_9ASTR|nr:hypothetical protein L1987_38735 [Smallanthus sonchifolius]
MANRHSEIQSRSLTIGGATTRNVRITSTPINRRFISVQSRGLFSHPQKSFGGCRFDNVGFWLRMKFIFQYLEKLLQNNRFTGPMAHNAMPPADKNKDNQSFKLFYICFCMYSLQKLA